MTVLFVNACLRGDESRTLTLCREYLEGIEDVKEVNLSEMRLEALLRRLGGLSRPVGGQGPVRRPHVRHWQGLRRGG